MKPPSTEALLWRITWTKAFPVVSQWLWSTKEEKEPCATSLACGSDGRSEEDDKDASVWHFIAFHCIWNHAILCNSEHMETGCKGPLPTSSTHSSEERVGTQLWSNSLGYGEITEGAVWEIVHHIRCLQGNGIGCINIQTVVDLGSGTGRVVFAAALAWQPKTVIGLEIVPALHHFASQRLYPIWNEECRLCGQENATRLDFRCCDFTVDTEWWVNEVDVIFVHGTEFEDALMEQVVSICRNANTGTWIVSISRPLVGASEWQGRHTLECLSELTIEMSWGRGMAFVYVVALKHM